MSTSTITQALPPVLEALVPEVLPTQGMPHYWWVRRVGRGRDFTESDGLHLARTGVWTAFKESGLALRDLTPSQTAQLRQRARAFLLGEVLGTDSLHYDQRRRTTTRRKTAGPLWDGWEDFVEQPESEEELATAEQALRQRVECLRSRLTRLEFECLWQLLALGRKHRELAEDLVRAQPVRYGGPEGFKRAMNVVAGRSARAMRKARAILEAA